MRRILAFASLLLMVSTTATPADAVPDRAEDAQPLPIGASLPDSMLKTLDGEDARLPALLDGSPAVLVFYRGGWCPFCNRQLSELRLIQNDLKSLGYRIIAISPDSPASLRKGLEKTPVEYTLLSDGAANLIRDLGIAFRVDAKTREKYREYGIDLSEASGHDHHLLPVPTVIVVDGAGVIRHLDSNPDYKVRPSNDEVLAAARANAGPSAQ